MYFITTQTENYTLEQQLILWGETLLSSELLVTIIQSGRSSTMPGGSTGGAAARRSASTRRGALVSQWRACLPLCRQYELRLSVQLDSW